jgi:hypothetical protein
MSRLYPKSITLLAVAGIALAAFISSCSKSTGAGAGYNPFTAAVNGNSFASDNLTGVYDKPNSRIQITSTQFMVDDTVNLIINIPYNSVVNKQVPNWPDVLQYGHSKGFDTVGYYSSSRGKGRQSLTLAFWDTTNHRIGGTFNGILYSVKGDSVSVTGGRFNATYSTH